MAGKGKLFGEGNPGNPAGRPKGARNRMTQAVEIILDSEAEALTRKAVEMTLGGDGPAMKPCLDRLCPPRKDCVVSFDLPMIATTAALLQAVAVGDLMPDRRPISARRLTRT